MVNAFSVRLVYALALLSVSGAAFADFTPNGVPEPGVLELAGIGVAAAVAVSWLRRRK